MANLFYRNIKPQVERELLWAKNKRAQANYSAEFTHLENAHVLGQGSTLLHTRVHILMFIWGVRQSDVKECLGQIFRIVGAATKTAIGFVPTGNTGGTNVSPFKVLPVPAKLASIIAKANSQ